MAIDHTVARSDLGSEHEEASTGQEISSNQLPFSLPAVSISSAAVMEAEQILASTETGTEGAPPGSRNAPVKRLGQSTFSVWSGQYVRLLLTVDAVVGALAMAAAIIAPMTLAIATPIPMWVTLLVIGSVAWPVAVAASHGYERHRVGVGDDEMRAVLRAAVITVAVGALPSGLLDLHDLLATIVVATPTAAAMSLTVRYVSRKILHTRQRSGRNVRTVVLAGSTWTVNDLSTVLAQETNCGMELIGVCVPAEETDRARSLGLSVLGSLDHIADVVREYGCDAVAVTSGEATRHNYLRGLAWSLESQDVELLVHPGLVEVAGPRMHIRPYVGLPLLHVEKPHFTGRRRLLKRMTDIALTGVGLLIISPVLLATALAIKIEDGGPVIFRQARVGLDGSIFTMLKFRSMTVDAEAGLGALLKANEGAGPMFKMSHDPRITRVGRFLRQFSLDELPQLFNVLAGSMSLVGPRPPLPVEVDAYESHARRRLLVTPGLTGLWQVSGRSLLSWEESVRLDLRYVENWTLTLDLHILWKTFSAVLRRDGAF